MGVKLFFSTFLTLYTLEKFQKLGENAGSAVLLKHNTGQQLQNVSHQLESKNLHFYFLVYVSVFTERCPRVRESHLWPVHTGEP